VFQAFHDCNGYVLKPTVIMDLRAILPSQPARFSECSHCLTIGVLKGTSGHREPPGQSLFGDWYRSPGSKLLAESKYLDGNQIGSGFGTLKPIGTWYAGSDSRWQSVRLRPERASPLRIEEAPDMKLGMMFGLSPLEEQTKPLALGLTW
jgi:hypothetical protein